MKKFVQILALAGSVWMACPGCKKGDMTGQKTTNDSLAIVNKKDTLISGRTWWGALIKDQSVKEYYAIHFNADSTLILSELSGEYPGRWSVSDNKITIYLPGYDVKITGDITKKNTIENFFVDNWNFQLITAQLLNNKGLKIANTNWSGQITQVDNGRTTSFQLNFLDASKLQFIANGFNFGSYDYQGSDLTGVFRFNMTGVIMFGIFSSDSHVEGMQQNENFLFEADKR